MIVVEITGHPVAKGRPRFTRSGIAFTPAKTRRWEDDARMVAREAMGEREPISGPLRCSVRSYFVPPASWPQWKRQAAIDGLVAHTARPDGDNLAKAAKDALNGVVWRDDAQVVQLWASKLYGRAPRVVIEVEPMHSASCQITKRSELPA
jgi:Holliday junction resolvase RusA-like endonuclease